MNVAEVTKMTIPELIDLECQNLAEMLKAKNRQYGNSFADPVRIFSRVSPEEGLRIVGDKLSRIARGCCREDTMDLTTIDLAEGMAGRGKTPLGK